VSTAAPLPVSTPGAGAYSLARPQGKCSLCGRDIAPGEKFLAVVRDGAAGLERLDLDQACWQSFDRAHSLAFWQAVMPTAAAARPKVFVDDTVLCDLFERLADGQETQSAPQPAAAEQARANFRFVLGLILMRKRLLAYESSRQQGGQEYWTVRLKGRQDLIDLANPKLNEEQVAQVSAQLGQVLNGEPA
jgi:hypothetical protein